MPRENQQTKLLLDALATLRAPAWQPYYARWERRRTWRLGGRIWTVRAEIEPLPVRPGRRGHARIDFVRAGPTASETKALIRDPDFVRVTEALQAAGYRPLLERLERSPHLFRRFPVTPNGLRMERDLLDDLLGRLPRAKARPRRRGVLNSALSEFENADGWRPSGAGWSFWRPVGLKAGGTIRFSILLVQRDDGTLVGSRDLRPVGSVLVTPARSARAAVERVEPMIKAAGYTGGLQWVRSTKTGRPAWMIGDFWKHSLGRGGIASERARLERLASELRNAERR